MTELEDMVDCIMFPAGTILARVIVKGKKAKARHPVLHIVRKRVNKARYFLENEIPLENGFNQLDVDFLLNLLQRRLARKLAAI
jgi:hypothetical protein